MLSALPYPRNLRVKAEYSTLIFQQRIHGVFYCFLLSDKLEPFVIIIALHPQHGRLARLAPAQVADLREAIRHFKDRFGINDETYSYTQEEARVAAGAGGVAVQNKAHSSHFHLKMRIATAMSVLSSYRLFLAGCRLSLPALMTRRVRAFS